MVQLVNVVDDKAIFLAVLPSGYHPGYGIAEISRDAGTWTVYKYTSPSAGMGHCKKDGDHTPDYCWRKVDLVESAAKGTLRLHDYYDYTKTFCEG